MKANRGLYLMAAGLMSLPARECEPWRTCIIHAKNTIGAGHDMSGSPALKEKLAEAIRLNLINQKKHSFDQLQRRMLLPISERQFQREKQRFVFTLAENAGWMKAQ